MSVRVTIFDDNASLLNTLKTLIDGVEGFEVVGTSESGEQAAKIVEELQPDIVIMDIDMPRVNGIEALRRIKEKRPETIIIMHTVFEDNERLFDSLCAGANGYLLKNTSFISLLEGIQDALNGGAPMSPTIAKKVLQSFHAQNKYHLSDREKEVLQYLVKGYSYKMIGATLFISMPTVQAHIKNIYTKLHVNCGREAVVKALKEKIV